MTHSTAPKTVSDLLRDRMLKLKLTHRTLSLMSTIPQSTLHDLIMKRRRLSPKVAVMLGKCFGPKYPASHWLKLQSDEDLDKLYKDHRFMVEVDSFVVKINRESLKVAKAKGF